jgi:hypothetical protein
MSQTHGPSEQSMGAPVGAVPQPPPGLHPDLASDLEQSQALRLSARSGDTQVVFRLNRDVPFLHRLAELARDRLERLMDNRRLVIAGAIALVAVVTLTAMIGGAYRDPPTPATPPAPAAQVHPVVLPLPAEPPAPPPAALEDRGQPAAPSPPATRPHKPRPRLASPKLASPATAAARRKAGQAPAAHPSTRPPTPPARW